MKRKLLAGFMAVCLILTLLPATALAADDGTAPDAGAGTTATYVAEVDGKQYETLQAAINEAADSATVTLLQDVKENITINTETNITLDLNGKNLTETTAMVVKGHLTIEDSTAASKPSVSDDYATIDYDSGKISNSGAAILVNDGGSLIVKSGMIESTRNIAVSVDGSTTMEGWSTPVHSTATIDGGYLLAREYGVGVYGNGAELNVTGGVIVAQDNAAVAGNGSYNQDSNHDGIMDNYGGTTINISGGTLIGRIISQGYIAVGIYHPQSGKINITGGTIYADNGVGICIRNGGLTVSGNAEVIATGTEAGKVGDAANQIPGKALVIDYAQGYNHNNDTADTRTVSVTGGTFKAEQETVEVYQGAGNKTIGDFITGGTFSSEPDADYLDADYTIQYNDDDTYTVVAKKENAAEVVPAAPEVKKPADLTGDDATAAETVASDLATTEVVTGTGLNAAATGVANENTITSEAGKQALENESVTVSESDTVTIVIQPYMAVEIQAVDTVEKTLTLDITPMYKTVATTDPDNIQLTGDSKNAVEIGEAQELTITKPVTVKIPVPDSVVEGSDTAYVTHIKDDGTMYVYTGTIQDGVLTFENPNGFSTIKVTAEKPVAAIDEEIYTSLQKAIDNAESGDTITLLDNVKASNAGVGVNNSVFTLPAGVTLDGNNWKIEADSENWTSAADNKPASHILSVIGASTDGTSTVIKNLTIIGVNDNENKKYSKAGIHAYGGADVQIEGVTIQNCGSVGIQVNGATVSTKDVQISGSNWGGINVDSNAKDCDSKLTVNSTIIEDENSIYVSHDATPPLDQKLEVIVESGTFQSISTLPSAVGNKDAITINGGTITDVTNAGAGSVDIKDGTITNVTNAGAGSVDITGGTITNVANEGTGPIYVQGGTITNVSGDVDVSGGTVTGNVDIKPDDGECVIIYKIDGETVYARAMAVIDDSVDQGYQVSTKPGYTFSGWTCDDSSVTEGLRDGKYPVWKGVKADMTYVFTGTWIANQNSFDHDRPSSGGSSVSTGDYGVSVSGSKHGDVSVSPNRADEGDTVTITAEPDRGYEVGEVTVTDKNGDEIRVRDRGDGEYTFTMPDGRVTVKVTFVEERAELPFADVASDAYYYDAVAWAVENGITGGTTPTTFAPGNPCTRAQTVTFLWRAAGMPQAANRVNPFTDVSESDYYYEAVLWAVENGITSGTTATTFGPSTTCTRAQVATFLWRYSKEDASTLPMFTDVAESDYYYGAVAWAVENGVTQGVTETAFQPGNPCTRGQIVTFLYRYMGE